MPFKVPANIKNKKVFHTGIDITSKSEIKKRQQRAERFGVPVFNPVAKQLNISSKEIEQRKKRAEKWGAVDNIETRNMDKTLEEPKKSVLTIIQSNEVEEIERRTDALHIYGT